MKKPILILMALLIFSSSIMQHVEAQNALSFDGTNDYVSIPFPSMTLSSFSVEMWIKKHNTANTHFFSLYQGSNYIVLGSYGASGIDTWAGGLSPVMISYGPQITEAWFHVAFTWDGSQQVLYINGTAEVTQATTGSLSNSGSMGLTLGCRYTKDIQFANADIDEVRFWNYARTQSQIEDNKDVELTGNEPGLLLYYNFNQGTAGGDNSGITTLNDITPNGLNGTLTNFALTGATSNWVDGTSAKINQTITFDALDAQTYGAADFDPGATASSGLTVTYTSSNTDVATIVSNKVHITGAGTTTIHADQAGDATYNAAPQESQDLTVNTKELTVTGAVSANKIYDGTTDAVVSGATLSGVIGSDVVLLNKADSGKFASAAAGTGKSVTTTMFLTGSDSANYTLAQPSLTADITARELNVTGAVAANKVYDGTTDAVVSGAALTGVIGSDAVLLNKADSGKFVTAAVGTGKSVTTAMFLTGSDSANYTVAQPALTADITAKALTVTGAAAANKVYDGTTDAVVSGAALSGVIGSDAVLLNKADSGKFDSAAAGIGKSVTTAMFLTGSASANYTLTQPTLTADITRRIIEITADPGQHKNAGEADPAFTYVITGGSLVSGDNLTGALARTAGETAGEYAIEIGTLSAGSDYTISFISANFEIKSVTAVSENIIPNLMVYPNPFTDCITISSASPINTVRLINIHSQIMKEVYGVNLMQMELDLRDFAPGVYLLAITGNNKISYLKIVKK
jgi:hypothetical protein